MARSKRTKTKPFLLSRVEPVPVETGAGATYQRETIKQEGQ